MPLPPPSPDQPAVITGASLGIGKAIAHELAARGYPVLLVARQGELLEALAAEIREKYKVGADVRVVDLVDPEARSAFQEELASLDVSILVANAGFATQGLWHKGLDYAKERAEVELNVVAAYENTLAVLPKMLKRRSGGVVLTGSNAGNNVFPTGSTYAATKAFVNTFAESLHFDVKSQGVHVTLLAPGFVETALKDDLKAGLFSSSLFTASAEHTAKATVDGLVKNKLRVVPILAHKIQTAMALYSARGLYGRASQLLVGRK
ncbi:SDR family NAD(P)-dependent oxidoreductase [Segniliparus rugosus]|uniref:Short-chain dehydrogenase n=1 Tax=Segniliparus rugosus (strain ATCC BAA-974 / DSM 45345 / CCUG 50838 / CIP 108380 / JCM 13579 / CDC 945) TaxID=679197 RepID=E5XQM9_SEGRC|nr:SDR family NAD(P)-dependent oxidoreductase [Segniliparus rugosus]EFV13342.1 hypothetical protein HMPREF9336_01801 [Segniliparus rugosus ATCC BAA-974]